jgi:hypothetical protein
MVKQLFNFLKQKIKKKYKDYRYFWVLKKIYNFINKKNSFYHALQSIITNIKLRNYFSKLEKSFFRKVYSSAFENFFKHKINTDNENATNIKRKGISKQFILESFSNNKNEICDYFYNQKFFSDKDPNTKYNLDDKANLKVGYFSVEDTLNCPHIFKIANDEKIINTLASYFQCPFKLDYINSWWSFKNPGSIDEKTQYFHRDLDNFNFIKMFLYLTDVDINKGAHQYVVGSHNKTYNLQISRSVINKKDLNFDNLEIFDFVGESGSALLADTFGLHRGATPINGDRLMIVFSYSVKNSIHSINKRHISSNFRNKIINNNFNKYLIKNFIDK